MVLVFMLKNSTLNAAANNNNFTFISIFIVPVLFGSCRLEIFLNTYIPLISKISNSHLEKHLEKMMRISCDIFIYIIRQMSQTDKFLELPDQIKDIGYVYVTFSGFGKSNSIGSGGYTTIGLINQAINCDLQNNYYNQQKTNFLHMQSLISPILYL